MELPKAFFPILILLAGLLIYFSLAPPEQVALVPIAIRHGVVGGLLTMMALIAVALANRPSLEEKLKAELTPEYPKLVILGTPEEVTLYEAYSGQDYSRNVYGHYTTPERAFAANPYSSICVRPVKYYKVGDKYIEDLGARLIDLRVDFGVKDTKEATA